MNSIPNSTEARVEAIEARMDGRAASMEATFAMFSRLMDERQQADGARMDRMEAAITEIRMELRTSIAGLRTTIVVTGITSVLAIVFGVAAFNATVLSNMIAAFESGKNTTAAQAEMKKLAEDTTALIARMQQELDKKNPQKEPVGNRP